MSFNKLTKALSVQKNVTKIALEKLHLVLDEVNAMYPDENIFLGEIKLTHTQNAQGYSHTGYALKKELHNCDYDDFLFIPKDIEELNSYWHHNYSDFGNISREDVRYIMKNIKKWVDELIEKENDFNKEIKVLIDLFK